MQGVRPSGCTAWQETSRRGRGRDHHCRDAYAGYIWFTMIGPGMLKSFVRQLFSAVVVFSFGLSTLTLGATPFCATSGPDAPAHGHSASHDQPQGGQQPGSAHCAVHLCCANMSTPVLSTLGIGRSFAAHPAGGFAAVSSAPESKPAHLLPFAHAPPPASI
jgi:hypothetical protein